LASAHLTAKIVTSAMMISKTPLNRAAKISKRWNPKVRLELDARRASRKARNDAPIASKSDKTCPLSLKSARLSE
ncbi:MAG TPA: hypothetical protein PLO51_05590, partial [Candidatus Micrarchaeota archaeon]|nr:hypothetical protein [Candidatus Micrarchaeota archaeon]